MPVLTFERVSFAYVSSTPLLTDLDFQLEPGWTGLAGSNGAGKTTLLEALLATARVPEEQLLYLPQELDAEAEARALEQVRALPLADRDRVLTILASLGVDPERLLASRRPSPGEARKLVLASGMGRRVPALVLDEPTNHLDLPSVERIERALAAYPGALLLVTHDPRLAAACTQTRWLLAEQRVCVASK